MTLAEVGSLLAGVAGGGPFLAGEAGVEGVGGEEFSLSDGVSLVDSNI